MITYPRLKITLAASILFLLFSARCQGPGPIYFPEPTPVESATPGAARATSNPNLPRESGANPAPRVIEQRPASAEEAPLDSAFEIVFNQPMDPGRTEAAWQVTGPDGQALAGEVTWPEIQTGDGAGAIRNRVLRFAPQHPLQPGGLYLAKLEKTAASQAGAALPEALHFTFRAVGDLAVAQVSPADGARDVSGDVLITAIFNHPVVPLLAVEEQGSLPQPLEITPAVPGQGEWLNTSVYAFRPEKPLPGGQTYRVVVKAGLEDTLGGRLAEDLAWEFTTIEPSVESLELPNFYSQPPDGLEGVPLEQSFAITFRQPMDRESVQSAFSLNANGTRPAEVAAGWNDLSTRVVFTPTAFLELGTPYVLRLENSARAADGGRLGQGIEWRFTTVLPPGYAGFSVGDGDMLTSYVESFHIDFVSPVKYSSLEGKVVITPEPEGGFKYYLYDKTLVFYGLQPSTRYEVRILPGIEDRYGNPIMQSAVLRFTNGPYQPSAYLLMPQTPALIRAAGKQEFYASSVNVRSLQFSVFRLTLQEFDRLQKGEINLMDYQPQSRVRAWEAPVRAGKNQRLRQSISLVEGEGGRLPPGVYLLTLDSPEVEHTALWLDARIVIVSEANLTLKTTTSEALLWLTDLESGEPLPGARVTIYDEFLNEIGRGATGPDGLAEFAGLAGPAAYAVAGDGNGRDGAAEAFTYRGWESLLALYDLGIYTDYYARPNQWRVYVYTDRPIYRPGQTVYFKGVARLEDDLHYSLPTQAEVQVSIYSFDETVYTATLPLSEMGTFAGEFTLDVEAALGEYRLNVGPDGKDVSGGVSFTVAEYHKPEFQVSVRAAPSDVMVGDVFTATVEAGFYSGGAVAGARVTWSLTAQRFFFSPKPEDRDLGIYSFMDYDQDVYFYEDPQAFLPRVIAQGEGVTGPDGKLHLELPAELVEAGDALASSSLILTLEATVTDLTGNQVSDRAQVTAHRSAFYPGVRSSTALGIAGKAQPLFLVVVDWAHRPAAGWSVDVEVVERRWHSVQEEDNQGRLVWKSTVEEITVARFAGVQVDEHGKAQVEFVPPNGGIYRARITVRDDAGNLGSASTYVWVAGEDYVPWRQSSAHTFELVPDRDSYSPGDQAGILIASPFAGKSLALVTVERGHLLSREVIRLETNSTIYPLPITSEMAPNVYVSVMVLQGVGQAGRPGFKVGMAALQVNRRDQELQVEVTSDREEAGPGEAVTYTVQTRDAAGNPVSAEVSLALVDQAVLSLVGPNAQPALDYFYPTRWLGVLTSVPLSLSIEDFNAELAEQVQRVPLGSGGGKGGGMQGIVDVREDFQDTAFWQARLLTDETGRATVTVRLPDNLTTWRMEARAVTLDTRVGEATSDLLTTRSLLVRPQTPRFLVDGDRVWLSAAIHNNTDQDLAVEAELAAAGVTLLEPGAQALAIPAGTQAVAGWWATVDPGVQSVDLVFRAAGGGFEDASRPTVGSPGAGTGTGIPVYRFEAIETVGAAGSLAAEGVRSEAIGLPLFTGAPLSQGELVVRVDPSLTAGLADGLDFLEHYPYECTEQTVSRFLPNVVITRALMEAGVSVPDLEAALAEQVNTALQRLYNTQHPDGGWGWWNEEKSDPQVSAYVVLGLLEAQRSAYPVSPGVLERGIGFLRSNLEPVRGLEQGWRLNRQAFLLYVLARARQPDPSRNGQLYEARQGLSLYAQGYLAQAMAAARADDPRLKTLAADFTSRAGLSASGAHWEEQEARDAWNWNTDLRTTAIVLAALLQIDPQNSLNENAVRWLMANRTQGHWGTTQETAWTLMALIDWAAATGELRADYQYEARLNENVLLGGATTPGSQEQGQEVRLPIAELLSGELNRLVFARSAGPGSLYYTAHLSVGLPVEQIGSLSRGVSITRQYFHLGDRGRWSEPVGDSVVGDLFLARLTVIAPHDLHYLVVEDPLPAGLEAVDQSLRISPQFVAGEGEFLPPFEGYWGRDPWGLESWGWWYFNHVELRDEKVVLSANYLPAGTYEYAYLVRAIVPGEYRVMPPTAFEFYFPEVYGRGEGKVFTVHNRR